MGLCGYDRDDMSCQDFCTLCLLRTFPSHYSFCKRHVIPAAEHLHDVFSCFLTFSCDHFTNWEYCCESAIIFCGPRTPPVPLNRSFNQIEDDNDFVLACHIRPCNELLSSDLIYNPLGSDLEEINNQAEFDPDQNFYNEQNLFNGYSCSYNLEDSFNEKMKSCAFALSRSFSLCHVNIRSINANLSHFVIISNFYPSVSLLLQSLKLGSTISYVIYIPEQNTVLLSSIVAINVVVAWEYL